MFTEFCKIMFFVESKQEILQPEIFCIIHAIFMQNFETKIGSAGLRKIFSRGQNKTLLSLGNHFKRCFHACVDLPPPNPRQIYWLNVHVSPPHTQTKTTFLLPRQTLPHLIHALYSTFVQLTLHVYSVLYNVYSSVYKVHSAHVQCTQRTCTMYIAHMYNVHRAHVQCTQRTCTMYIAHNQRT